jgi:rubrerythrin
MSSLAEALQTSLELEQKGHDYYVAGAARLKDSVMAAVLGALAADEIQHQNLISRYYRALQRSEGWPAPTVEDETPAPARERIDAIVAASAGAVQPDDSYLEIYARARELEIAARDFYRGMAEEAADDAALAKFFRFLAGVEQTHLEMLGMVLETTRDATQSLSGGGKSA